MSDTTIGISDDVKARLEPVKEKSGATSWDEFMDDLVAKNIDIDLEELDETTGETRERIEQTRATIAGVLEALDDAGMVDEAVAIIKELTQQRMLAEHRQIVDHLLEKSKNDEPINEVDRLLARMVIETEGARDQETPAAEIARGLFDESTTAERTTRQPASPDSETIEVDDEMPLDDEESELFDSGETREEVDEKAQ